MNSVNTTCLWFDLDSEGNILKKDFAWPDPYDRKGNGEDELDCFLECTRDNGFSYTEVYDLDVYYNGGKVRVFKFEEWGEERFFGLIVEDVDVDYSKKIYVNE